ncbi:MAG TPA: glycine cleavage system aminomethyltransferase GcvT [Thermomicrobiales bacterium]|nr:glycine cleavage system aminomethyltransferase GcvT [Thermomicrobiales bacterium]
MSAISAETTSPAQAALRRTPLFDRHVGLGARMVPFAGWEMPVQYSGVLAEHRAVRSAAGLFDLGHMGQGAVRGPDALPFLQYVTSNDVARLEPGQAQYGLLPNPDGGVIDDIITYRRPDGDGYMVVINAANAEKDVSWLHEVRSQRTDLDVEVTDISDRLGMIAIQGPRAEEIVQRLTDDDLSTVGGFSWRQVTVAGIPLMIARTGYTGEDGFEFYPPIDQTGALWDALMNEGASVGLVAVGLGARDTLRLEARMPLYGNELTDDISALEAGLGWAVKLDKGEFIGREAIQRVKDEGPSRRTVGFRMIGRSGTPRAHFPVQVDGSDAGFVTSGAFSPTLDANIGLALVRRDVAGVGKPLDVIIRDKPTPATQVKLPFYRRSENG